MADDDLFGPHLPGLFDFTLLFEQSILSLLPTALFILLTPLRIFPLCKATDRVKSGVLLWMKCVSHEHPDRLVRHTDSYSGCHRRLRLASNCVGRSVGLP